MNKLWLLAVGLPSFFLVVSQAGSEELPSPQVLIIPGIIIFLLIILNGLFVAAEFAISGIRPTQMEELVDEGNQQAKHVLATLESPEAQDRYIATAQLGITIASLGLGMYGEPQIAHFIEPYLALILGYAPDETLIHTLGYIIALSLLTYLHVVVGEMVPKSIALSMATKAALIIARPMQFMELVFKIPVQALNNVGNYLVRLLRIPPAEEHIHSPEELGQIIAESAAQGLINKNERVFINNILTFSERHAHQVMTPRRKIQAIPANISLPDLINFVSTSRYSRFPVYEEDLDHIIGIIHLKDLVRQQLRSKGTFDLRLLLHPAPTVPESFPVEKLLNAFKRQRLHMAILLDEFGGTAGLVTLEDLVEEVVGEVRDEFDKKEQDPFIRLGPGEVEVSGQFLIDDLVARISLGDENALPDVETVGGLIITLLGRPPQVDDKLIYNQAIKFTVLAIDGLAVNRVRIDHPEIDHPEDVEVSDNNQEQEQRDD